MTTHATERDFESLISDVAACVSCPRMTSSQRIIGRGSGRTDAPIMFVGEAPGRLGADSSAIPFHGDKAGENFENLLEQVGLTRYACFITNAVLCNPKDEKGNNATPTRMEVANCSSFLKRQIDLVNPKIVVSLGGQALHALTHIEQHQIALPEGVRKKWAWYGRILIPLYHPGQRAMLHRSFFNQLVDYQFVAEAYRRLGARRRTSPRTIATLPSAVAIVRSVLNACGPISYFALHKLFYLIEYEHYRQARHRATRSYIVRQKDGPYVIELNLRKLKKAVPELKTWSEGNKLMIKISTEASLFMPHHPPEDLEDEVLREIVGRVVGQHGSRSDDDLKRVVYLTAPMRHILRREKYRRENMFNSPIDFSVI